MAKESPILPEDFLFIGEDRTLQFTVVDANEVVVDISGFSIEFILKEELDDAVAEITITTPTITFPGGGSDGIFNVPIADTDTDALAAGQKHYAVRRTDDGLETVLAFGTFELQKAAAPV